jgi:hypothetical protein
VKRLPFYLSLLLLLTCAKEDSQVTNDTPSNITPRYTLTASAGEGGSVSPATVSFNAGTQVSVTATPNSGYQFTSWSNGSTANPLNVTLNSNISITANFTLTPVYSITVSAEDGGSVSSNGGEYQEGTQLTITANPNEGYEFNGWSNGSNDNPLILTINSDVNIVANFLETLYYIPSDFKLESNYLSPETYYSIELFWDESSNSNATSVNIYKGESAEDLVLYESIDSNLNTFKDIEVSVRKEYFYQISFVYGDYEHDKTEAISIETFEPENELVAPTNFPMPRGIHYAYQHFNQSTFESVKHTFTIHQEPSNNGKLYYQFYNGRINDTIGFYYGIQTDMYSPQPPTWRGRGLVFSRWNTRDINNYSIAENGFGQSAGYEGDFIGVRNSFNWGVGTYETEFKKDSTDNIGDWYSLKIRNILEDEQTYIGSIRFESSSISSGIKSGGSLWTELYSNASDGTIPDWHVSVDDIIIDGEFMPNRIDTYYSETFKDFSNIYTTNKNDIHFLVGPKVKNITPVQQFYWNED